MIFQFISLGVAGAVKKKKAKEPEWEELSGRGLLMQAETISFILNLFESQRTHLPLADGRRHLMVCLVPSSWPGLAALAMMSPDLDCAHGFPGPASLRGYVLCSLLIALQVVFPLHLCCNETMVKP